MKPLESRRLRRRRLATAAGVAVGALALRAAAARSRTRGQATPPAAQVRTLTAEPPAKPAPRTVWEPPPPSYLVHRRVRQARTAAVLAAAFALTGIALISVTIMSQRTAPLPPPMTLSFVDATQAPTVASAAPADRPDSWPRSDPLEVIPTPSPAVQNPEDSDAVVSRSDVADSVVPATAVPLASSKPVRIEIPAIDVSSVVRSLGQAADGSLEVPTGAQYNDAGWYRYSPTPGSLGPAVMLGHVDSAAQGPSVFFRLGDLRRGNRVTVTRADGSVAVFVVDSVRRYAKDDFPTEVVYSDIDHAGLRIVTCGGAFDNAAGSYLDNIVVFASLTDAKG